MYLCIVENVGGRNRKLRVPIYNIRTLYNKHIKN